MSTEKHILFWLLILLVSDNPLRFRKCLKERIQKLIMTIDDKIRDEKRQ